MRHVCVFVAAQWLHPQGAQVRLHEDQEMCKTNSKLFFFTFHLLSMPIRKLGGNLRIQCVQEKTSLVHQSKPLVKLQII